MEYTIYLTQPLLLIHLVQLRSKASHSAFGLHWIVFASRLPSSCEKTQEPNSTGLPEHPEVPGKDGE